MTHTASSKSLAPKTKALNDKITSTIQKSLATSVLSQSNEMHCMR